MPSESRYKFSKRQIVGERPFVIITVLILLLACFSLQAEDKAPGTSQSLDDFRKESKVGIDFDLAVPIDLSGDGTWQYVPDAGSMNDSSTPMQVPLAIAAADHHEPERTLFLPQEKKVVVVYRGTKASQDPESTRCFVCDYDRGRVETEIDTGRDVPIAISPDGKSWALSHVDELQHQKTALTICSRNDSHFLRQVSWQPYGTHEFEGINWSEFTDSSHLITLNSAGELALWNVPKIWPEWAAKLGPGATVGLSFGRKYLAVAKEDGLKLFNLTNGSVAGTIPTEIQSVEAIAFHPNGKRLAVWSADRIRVWDLESASLDSDFGLQRSFNGRGHGKSTLDWIGDGHLLLDGQLIVDLTRRVASWKFTNVGSSTAAFSKRLWFVDQKSTMPKLCSLSLPNRESIEAVSQFIPQQMLVLQPGIKVAVEVTNDGGSGDVNAARAMLVKKLKENGVEIVGDSPVRVLGQIISNETQQVRIRMWSALGPTTDEQIHEFIPHTVLLQIFSNGEEVWKRGFTAVPHGFIQLQENESIDQALQKLTNASIEDLGKYHLPRYLARIPGDSPP